MTENTTCTSTHFSKINFHCCSMKWSLITWQRQRVCVCVCVLECYCIWLTVITDSRSAALESPWGDQYHHTYCRLAISFLMCTQQQPEQKHNKQKHHQNTNNISNSSSREHQLCKALTRAGLCDCVCKAAFQLKKQVELGMGTKLPNRKMFPTFCQTKE